MNHDERDNLWELLGRARPPKARPAFLQNVLRAVRMSEPGREIGFFEWLRRGANWLAFAGAAAVVMLVALSGRPEREPKALTASETAAIDAALASSDFAVVNNLDLLVAFEHNNAWLDSSRP